MEEGCDTQHAHDLRGGPIIEPVYVASSRNYYVPSRNLDDLQVANFSNSACSHVVSAVSHRQDDPQQRPQRRPRPFSREHRSGYPSAHPFTLFLAQICLSCRSCSQNSSPRAIASKVRVPCSTHPFVRLLDLSSLQGLAFHPTQPLLAAALHNGSVQLWNYRMGVLVDRFEEHEGTLSLSLNNTNRPG